MITIGYNNPNTYEPRVCEINYINYWVIYLTFEEKFGKMKRIDLGYY